MNEWLQPAILFVLVASMTFPVVLLWVRGRARRVRTASADADDAPPELVFGNLTPALSQQIQISPGMKAELEKELRAAGFYRPTAFLEYSAVRAVLVVIPMIATLVVALLAPAAQMSSVLFLGALAVGLGYSLPRLYLNWRGRVRNRQIERGLPLAIDLMTLCLTAGQNLLASLQEVAQELRNTHPDLATDIAIAHQMTRLHSLEHAMKDWADRVHSPEVTNLALLLIQSERLGTGAAGTLNEFSAFLRTSARQRAEAQANRTNFWMLFPSVFCFWIAAAIILIGPAYFEFLQHRQQAAVHFNRARTNINRANEGTKTAAPDQSQPGTESR